MPKSYTENERAIIKKSLKQEAMDCMRLYGIRKTTVDELVKRVHIPKGTFYLFYESKELLMFDALNDFHDMIQSEILRDIQTIISEDCINVDCLTQLFTRFFIKSENDFLPQLLFSGELELLMRKLPPEVVASHHEKDDMSVGKLLQSFPGINVDEKTAEIYSAAFRAVFLSILHKREIGEKLFYESLELMLRGLIIQIMEVTKKND